MGRAGEKQKRRPKIKDAKQSERFKKMAKELGADESSDAFGRIVDQMAQRQSEASMAQFYLSEGYETEVLNCRRSSLSGTQITVSGTNEDGSAVVYTGIVQSVEEDKDRPIGRRFRITIKE